MISDSIPIVTSKVHHEGNIGWGGDSTGSKADDRELAKLLGLHDEDIRGDDAIKLSDPGKDQQE